MARACTIDWGTLMLFGGGLSLGTAMFRTGLAGRIGDGLVALTGAHELVALTFLFGLVAIVLTETTSNTASATMLGPLTIAAAQAAGVSPVAPDRHRARCSHGVHASGVDASERDRLRVGVRLDHRNAASWLASRPGERGYRSVRRAADVPAARPVAGSVPMSHPVV